MTIRGGNQQRNDPLRSGETWTWRQVAFIGKDKLPTRQQDWPVPNAPWLLRDNSLLTWTHSPNPVFNGIPGTVTEWGLSWTTPFEQTWIQGVIKTVVQNPFRQSDWPLPIPSFRMEQTWLQGPRPIGTPLRQSDWPLPGQPFRLDQFWVGNNPGSLRAPFNQRDWPLPTPQSRLDATYIYSYNLSLIGKDKLPNRQSDWPIPNPVQWYKDWQVNLLQSTLTPVPGIPRRPFDWPLPIYPSRIDQTWIVTGNALGAPPLALMPSVVTEWGVNTETFYQNDLHTWFNQPRGVVTQSPFSQYDWPLPSPVYRLDQTWTRTSTYLQGQDRLPNRQQDWPNPPSVLWYQAWNQSPAIPIPPKPFFQVDWPNPQPVQWYRDWEYTYRLQGQDTLPKNQKDWPLPTPVKWYQDWSTNLVQSLKAPFRQLDWPNPQPVQWYRDWYQNLQSILHLLNPKPFFQADWPLPTQPSRIDPTWLGAFNNPPIASIPFPIIPIILKRGYDSWTQWSSGIVNGRRQRIKSWTAPFASR